MHRPQWNVPTSLGAVDPLGKRGNFCVRKYCSSPHYRQAWSATCVLTAPRRAKTPAARLWQPSGFDTTPLCDHRAGSAAVLHIGVEHRHKVLSRFILGNFRPSENRFARFCETKTDCRKTKRQRQPENRILGFRLPCCLSLQVGY